MLKKLILHLWSIRRQFFRYFLVGFSGLFLDLGTFYILTDWVHLRPVLAVMVNGILMLNYIFFLNKYWTFKSQGVTHKQMIRFFILAGFNYAVSIGWMFIFNEKIGVHHFIARISNILISVAWNFVLYKYWVYRHEKKDVLDAAPPPIV
jgi:dolichol-phosphate mannosyltransferase